MRKRHPDTFEAPTPEEVGQLSIGDFIKVSCHQERFWAIVTEIRMPAPQDVFNAIFVATVDNRIIGTAPCKYGDSILVHGYEIYAITHPDPIIDQKIL